MSEDLGLVTPMLSTHMDIIWLVDPNDYVAEWWYNSKNVSEKFSNNNLNIQNGLMKLKNSQRNVPSL